MKLIITENQEKSLKEKLQLFVKNEGWDRTEIRVGEKNLLKIGFDNNPGEFLNLFNDLNIVQSEQYSNWTLFRYKPNENLMVYDRKNDVVYLDYDKIWSVLRFKFGLKSTETKGLTEEWLDEVYNLRGITTEREFLYKTFPLGEVYNLRGITTEYLKFQKKSSVG